MEPFVTVTGPGVPMLRANIDTDVIIRVERLVGTTKAEMGAHAFEVWRRRADGSEDPACPLNRPAWRGAPILLAGANFGCGSSREGAVWALAGMGVRAVIAPSFSDIFANNALQNGLLPVVLAEEAVTALAAAMEAAPGNARITVDLAALVVISPTGEALPFAIDPARREALLAGLDDIGLTLRQAGAIATWQAQDRAARPWVWRAGAEMNNS